MSASLLANPIKLSQPAGAALAFMGIKGAVPLWHGVQGCTAFAKILFIGHFREPFPFQTTALAQTSVVMGGDPNVIEAVDNLASSSLIGLLTTGVAETSGVDLGRLEKEIAIRHPKLKLAAVSTPDFEGSLQTGWVKACEVMLNRLVAPKTETKPKQVLFLMGPYFTPGEVEELRELCEFLGLDPLFFPDLGDSLLGYLGEEENAKGAIGGIEVEQIKGLSNSALVISLGQSMKALGQRFSFGSQTNWAHFDHLAQLDELDSFYLKLLELAGLTELPKRLAKQRAHFLDVLLDTEYYFYEKSVALVGDPELIHRWRAPLTSMGLKCRAYSGVRFEEEPAKDLKEVEADLSINPANLLLGNSHVAELAEYLDLAALRTGYPVEDQIGEPTQVRLGYKGAAHLFTQVANALMEQLEHATPYQSPLQATLL
ncbi:MAG: nitrogenase iron-molybdenum cofactor biosynthesis protein NifN [Candidatus Lambdaproteobacteria bacterium RIFOXYD2_FULL_50_16]|uniref:Nitrogenase iron-molybdenum cofactor biosynthesis protein NifN n=1 Tax=Candidatus Lambdaproteobacteria bacterium RIFOXYD2_FULL_50_16 TaxID=1817772 RepID=A0A1F6G8R1_9PROT|nr:MAG: nitrogenase iron-molybdenum cofactor biosynthesis protein NifN [Candidatus Lambdaproteobacteria bacterium RIFOXYD2_FULL_50_16]